MGNHLQTKPLNEKSRSVYKKAETYIKKVSKDIRPEIFDQANFILKLMKKGKKPSNPEVLKFMDSYMSKYRDEINPIESIDSHGVSLAIGYLVKDSKKAGTAKRYYNSLIDAWIKSKWTKNKGEEYLSENKEQSMDLKTKTMLKNAIKEALDVDTLLLSAGEGTELKEYNKKVENFLNETFESADKLAEEGETLLRENYFRMPAATERRRVVLSLIGYLRETRNSIGNILRLRYLIG